MTVRRLVTGIIAALIALLVIVPLGLWLTSPGPDERDGWSLGPALPWAFGELATVALTLPEGDERLVVLSGIRGLGRVVDDVLMFNPATDTWEAGPPMPAPRHHAAAANLDGAVVLAGGAESLAGSPWQGSRRVWSWRPGAAWQPMPGLPEARWGHRLVEHWGRLYAIGGHGETANTFIYRPDHEGWAVGAPIPEPRDHLSVVVVGDEIWAIGGRNPEPTRRVDIYDPGMDSWSRGPDLPAATSGAAEAVVDGRILIYGGEDPRLPGGGIVRQHWQLDTRQPDPEWQPAPPPPLAVHGADGAVLDGRMVIIGGASRHGLSSVLAWRSEFQILESLSD